MTRTNITTQAIIAYLNGNGYNVWRNNNNAVYDTKKKSFRKNPTTKLGVGDITGYRKCDGKHIEVEVKTGKDKLSLAQIYHHQDLRDGHCIIIVAHDLDGFINEFQNITI